MGFEFEFSLKCPIKWCITWKFCMHKRHMGGWLSFNIDYVQLDSPFFTWTDAKAEKFSLLCISSGTLMFCLFSCPGEYLYYSPGRGGQSFVNKGLYISLLCRHILLININNLQIYLEQNKHFNSNSPSPNLQEYMIKC